MKLNVGDYVRNKYGIAKIIDIKNTHGIDVLIFDKDICFLVNKETGEIKDDKLFNQLAIIEGIDINKINSSSRVIDLIEVGDYVNGDRVLDIAHAPRKALYTNKDFSALLPIENRQIYSVITKEQIEQMEYKVED